MILSKEQESVKYLMRARSRVSSFPNETPPDNLCRLFWETFARAVVEMCVLLTAGLSLVGAFFIALYILSGMDVPEPEHVSLFMNVAIPLGIFLWMAIIVLVGGVAALMIKEGLFVLWKKIPSRRVPEAPESVNVAFEYAKSFKDRWCPMIRYKEDLR